MIQLRPSGERGHFNHGWLDTYHTFSFADYSDPRHMGFHALRVINEDRVAPGQGFAAHSHRDMEILTYVLEGRIEHQDSMGNKAVITPGEVQRMSAGTGVTHSEYNPSTTEPLHLLQIWILPEKKGLPPGYEQKRFDPQAMKNKFCLLASGRSNKAAVKIHQDAELFACKLEKGQGIDFRLGPDRYAWVQMARGEAQMNGNAMRAGDGAAVSREKGLSFSAEKNSEILVFDLV